MQADALASAMIPSMAQELDVPDLIRAVELMKKNGQAQAVVALYAAWIAGHPNHPLLYAVLFNYAVTLSDSGQLDAARQMLEHAIAQNPEFMPAYINVGRVYERLGNVGLALTHWSVALSRMSAITGSSLTHKTTALNQSARALEAADQDEAAEQMLRHSVELDATQREAIQHLVALRQRQCEWPVLQPSERVDVPTLLRGLSPLSAAALSDDPLYQLGLAGHYNRLEIPDPRERLVLSPNTQGPLRIGYLSSDLREHAVGYLMTEVFALHDRTQVEVFAYYCGPASTDSLHAHFRATADHFVSLNELDDKAAAERIAKDGIQILVDLNGYTRDARLKVVARRPAPIIVNWLGFPGTMGSPYHHYLIADDWIIPHDYEHFYTEKVVRLPCYQPSLRQRTVATVNPSRKDAGLPEDAVVYCCFNGTHKLHPSTFERWLSILNHVPNSVLWLLGNSPATQERLWQCAEARGVSRGRLIFASKLANSHHLARYPLADLFLDTNPYGAHTTASDALWSGVPVLTCSGRSFASRVCGSLARAAGVPELVCETEDQYIQTAIRFGQEPARLHAVRERLRAQRAHCTLLDMPLLVQKLEGLYRGMWSDYEQGSLPRPDLRNLDVYLELGSDPTNYAQDIEQHDAYASAWLRRLHERHTYRPLNTADRFVSETQLENWQ
jgi:predicted O-linked N-acetylglucosamine transferase (SPINDLY family)